MKYGINKEEDTSASKHKWRIQTENDIGCLKLEIALLKSQLQNNKNLRPIKNELNSLKFELSVLKDQLQETRSDINNLIARNICTAQRNWDNASKRGTTYPECTVEAANNTFQKDHEFTPLFPQHVNSDTNSINIHNPFKTQLVNNINISKGFNAEKGNVNCANKDFFNPQCMNNNNASKIPFNPFGPSLCSASLAPHSVPFGTQVLKGTRTVPYRATPGLDYKGRLPYHTRLNCITTMSEYEDQSLEELRAQDYLMANPEQQDPWLFIDYGMNNNGGPLPGTVVERYPSTWTTDPFLKLSNYHHNNIRKQTFANKSFEELQLEDSIYKVNKQPSFNLDTFRNTLWNTEKKKETKPDYFTPAEPVFTTASVKPSMQEELLEQALLELKKLDANLTNVNCRLSSMESHLSEIDSRVSVMDSRLSSVDLFVTVQRFQKNWDCLESRLASLEKMEETHAGKSFRENLGVTSLKRRSSTPSELFKNLHDTKVDKHDHDPLLENHSLHINQSDLKKDVIGIVPSHVEDCSRDSKHPNPRIDISGEIVKPTCSPHTLDSADSNILNELPKKEGSCTKLSSLPVLESGISDVSNDFSEKTDISVETTEALWSSHVSISDSNLKKKVTGGDSFEKFNLVANSATLEKNDNDFCETVTSLNVENSTGSNSNSCSKRATTPESSTEQIDGNIITPTVSQPDVRASQKYEKFILTKNSATILEQSDHDVPNTGSLNVKASKSSNSKYATNLENSSVQVEGNVGATCSSSECNTDDEFVVVDKPDFDKHSDQLSGERGRLSFETESSTNGGKYLTMNSDITEYLEVNLRKKKELSHEFATKSDCPSVYKSMADTSASETPINQVECQSSSSIKPVTNDSFDTFISDLINDCPRKTQQSTPFIFREKQSNDQGAVKRKLRKAVRRYPRSHLFHL